MVGKPKKLEFGKIFIDLTIRIGDETEVGRCKIRLAKLYDKDAGTLAPGIPTLLTARALAAVTFGATKSSSSGPDVAHAIAEINADRHTIGIGEDGNEVGYEEDYLLYLCEMAAEDSQLFDMVARVIPPPGGPISRPSPTVTVAPAATPIAGHNTIHPTNSPGTAPSPPVSTPTPASTTPPFRLISQAPLRMWGWTSHVALNPTTNRKELLKVDSVKLKEISGYYSWYMRLQNHAMSNGVYVYNLQDATLNDVMGSAFATKYAHASVKQEAMSTLLFALLSHDDVIDKSLTHLRSAVQDASGNGYAALYNLHRAAKHPNLIEDDDVATEVPRQRSGESFSSYKQRLENYFISEELRGRQFTDAQAINLFKSNLYGTYKLKFAENIRNIYTPSAGQKVPFRLHFSQIAITCNQWAKELALPVPGKGTAESVNHLGEEPDTDDDWTIEDEHVHAINSGKECNLCGGAHDELDCYPLIDLVLMLDYMSKNKTTRQAIIEKHKGTKLRRAGQRNNRGRGRRDDRPGRGGDRERDRMRRDRERVHHIGDAAFEELLAETTPPAPSPDDQPSPPPTTSKASVLQSTPREASPETSTLSATNGSVLAVNDTDNALDSDDGSWHSSDDEEADLFFISRSDREHVRGIFEKNASAVDNDSWIEDGADSVERIHHERVYQITNNSKDYNAIRRSRGRSIRGFVDGGSMVTSTPHVNLLHNYEHITFEKYLGDAGGDSAYRVVGRGYLGVPTASGNDLKMECWHTPTLPLTVIGPGEYTNRHSDAFSGHTIFSSDETNRGYLKFHGRNPSDDVIIDTTYHNKKSFTGALTLPPCNKSIASDNELIAALTEEATGILWHHRLNHEHRRKVSDAHKYVDGVPAIKHPYDCQGCPICMATKPRRSSNQKGVITQDAHSVGTGLSADWGFIVQKSKNKRRMRQLTGDNNEQAFLLVADHFSDMLYGIAAGSKAPPLVWLNRLLTELTPGNERGKYVTMDQGGEMAKNGDVRKLFERHKYALRPTAPGASHQNAPAERPIQTFGNAMRAMLQGAALPMKYWPYAFYHFIRIHNLTPRSGERMSPFEKVTGKRPNLANLRTFGCRVWVRPPGRRSDRRANHQIKGVFLGYTATMSQIVYLDIATTRVKTSIHATFDEGMNDLDVPTPNARALHAVLGRPMQREEQEQRAPSELSVIVQDSPFLQLKDVAIHVHCDHDTLGLSIKNCEARGRGYLADIAKGSSAATIKNWRRTLVGAYIIQVNDVAVYSKSDIEEALIVAKEEAGKQPKPSVRLTLAPDSGASTSPEGTPQLAIDQLRHVVRLVYEMEHGYPPTPEEDLDDHDIVAVIDTRGSARTATVKKKKGSSQYTRRELLGREDWPEWHKAEHKMLDNMEIDEMYGKPVHRSQVPRNSIVLGSVWTYLIKILSQEKKARNCCNGSVLRKRNKHTRGALPYYLSFASCASQTEMRVFTAVSAHKNYLIGDGDATNAYAQSEPPSEPTYVRVDRQYQEWYMTKHGKRIELGMLLPVQHALQGHPESGRLWQEKIDPILARMALTNSKIAPCLYRGMYEGKEVLVCRQVDDFKIAAADRVTVDRVIAAIGAEVRFVGNPDLLTRFNGVDYEQTREYIRIHSETYIDKILNNHGWSTANKDASDTIEPLHPKAVNEIETTTGPEKGTAEADRLEKQMGFGYRQCIGEVIYAFVTTRPDIGTAVATLAKFSERPALCHYLALKRLFRYLRQTRTRGVIYWRSEPRNELPMGTVVRRPLDANDEKFVGPDRADQLAFYVDAAHATDLRTRRSMGGYVGTFSGTAVVWRAKWQPVVATSSTEAELISAVSAAKAAKHLRAVVAAFGIPQEGPTLIYEDNVAAILIANANKMTERARHVDIQYMAIQEWVERKQVKLDHIPGIINPSDALTKNLGWVLHWRHATRMMGYCGTWYTNTSGRIPRRLTTNKTG